MFCTQYPKKLILSAKHQNSFMTKFHIDKDKIPPFIKMVTIRSAIIFTIVTLLLFSIVIFSTKNTDPDFPIWIFFIIGLIILIAFCLGIYISNKKLHQFAEGKFNIENSILIFQFANEQITEINLNQIAVVHKYYSGTMIIKGNNWTKFFYLWPKRSGRFEVGGHNAIFIPVITSNYAELISEIKKGAKNALKL